ncbi:hypothetical protein SAMN05216419_105411 [Nitrosomonas cryotolerans]|uniref:UPF0276 protein SAMN02743940_1154 n=1 Tax=Nitrosomonas cryotolerans ATCC 49181 TaxID=1131553 RepID=A0A1N6HF96_9PROT|nr:DUF692 domain-containing protein [Nitrosomonas cryotolerans]SFQ06670.1 hypothetical protein SAMN05216419_105411 [Nitrosomonas cryotolerans]SIO18387.1 hypothetical protein SAMN02743940_1154 [Nitrosomonas cryotolerans ATCC 49181]
MNKKHCSVYGAGLGLRRALMSPLADQSVQPVDFWEIAPENWMGVGGYYGKKLRELTERYPFICHGLSLSIGGPSPLDQAFLQRLKRFMTEHDVRYYSEHLSYCSDDGHLYDLLPIPFTEDAVDYVADRIRRVQDTLKQRIAMENVSYYAAPGKEMEEIDFLNAVLEAADCDLLLDVNNIYVNSINHGYDAEDFLKRLPAERIHYIHVAGHYVEAEDLIIDTHGAAVTDPVWTLLKKSYQYFGVMPTLLERDFNIPSWTELLTEVDTIRTLQLQQQSRNDNHIQHA